MRPSEPTSRPLWADYFPLVPKLLPTAKTFAPKIRFDKKKGTYEIESYGDQYIKATNVRLSK
jgi:hypothetical protein